MSTVTEGEIDTRSLALAASLAVTLATREIDTRSLALAGSLALALVTRGGSGGTIPATGGAE